MHLLDQPAHGGADVALEGVAVGGAAEVEAGQPVGIHAEGGQAPLALDHEEVVAVADDLLGHHIAVVARAEAPAVGGAGGVGQAFALAAGEAAGGEGAAVGGEAAGDVAEVGLGAHALVGEALHEKAVAVVFEPLATGDVLFMADALAFAQVDDAPARPGRQGQAPVEGGGFGAGGAGRQQGRRAEQGGAGTAEPAGEAREAGGASAEVHGMARGAAQSLKHTPSGRASSRLRHFVGARRERKRR